MWNMNSGYVGSSMSRRAAEAYENGEKPLSKWTKKAILEAIKKNSEDYDFKAEILVKLEKTPVKALKEIALYNSSWHHTSSYCNSTDFYSVDFDTLEDISIEYIDSVVASVKSEKKQGKKEESEKWECKFLEWSGTRNHPKATECVEIGEIKGNWFYRENGSKKSINANGFRKIKKIEEV